MPAGTAETVLTRCDELAACTDEPGAITRLFASPALAAATDLLAGWMYEAGAAVGRDAIGNLIGRWQPEPGAVPRRSGTLLLGSHLDSVRDGGRYDGPLGLLVALAAIERLGASGEPLPCGLELIAFADEEGARYGTAYLGSSAVAGTFDPAWLDRVDADGIAMRDAILAAGGDPAAIAQARRVPDDLIGYLEIHIEQGPVLEQEGLPIGVVSGIAGQTRARVQFVGAAGHAGTVPMALRRDALCAAAEWIAAVEAAARSRTAPGLVATVGELTVAPGAPNVIPGRASLSLDVRHPVDSQREMVCRQLADRARAIGRGRGVEVSYDELQSTAAVACDERLTGLLAAAVSRAGHRVVELPSGAGHDAARLSRLTPVAMLFVRCKGGISHDPAEAVDGADVAAAIDIVLDFMTEVPTE